MQDNIYILSITEFLDDSKGDNLMRQAESKVDESRRAKAGRIRQPGAKAASLGAGLLLQLAVQDKLTKAGRGAASVSGENAVVSIDIHNNLIRLSPSQVLSKIETLVPLEFIYGKSGKPYLKEFPFYFNLSHSGEFVVCMVSDREIGVDIQEHRGGDMEKLAKRYFSRQEIQALEGCKPGERTPVFFDLWAAKEAYGKYTGDGIAESLELDFSSGVSTEDDWQRISISEAPEKEVMLQMVHKIPGYSLAICKGV